MAKKLSKRDVEQHLANLLRELKRCPPWLLVELIEGLMAERGCSEDEAIRELAEFETTTRLILEASQSIDEA